ncbi:hypothetical protein Pint_31709 [Pistacia integerrima]|uniref:Uncharacterized protein n=1 Tax=Pistacia integerrima TaxID=434235 RepID=A0ACC0XP57_9ROSI|nr:hypothetical protein Pint_31709 [Pistacia integerrima]
MPARNKNLSSKQELVAYSFQASWFMSFFVYHDEEFDIAFFAGLAICLLMVQKL